MSTLQKDTQGGPFGDLPDMICAGEKAAVSEALGNNRMPTPSGKRWDAIRAYYKLPEPERLDKVQSRVFLPQGWSIASDATDPYGRCCVITDQMGVKVGSTFMKNTGYDYYGSTYFDEERLKALGIIQ